MVDYFQCSFSSKIFVYTLHLHSIWYMIHHINRFSWWIWTMIWNLVGLYMYYRRCSLDLPFSYLFRRKDSIWFMCLSVFMGDNWINISTKQWLNLFYSIRKIPMGISSALWIKKRIWFHQTNWCVINMTSYRCTFRCPNMSKISNAKLIGERKVGRAAHHNSIKSCMKLNEINENARIYLRSASTSDWFIFST